MLSLEALKVELDKVVSLIIAMQGDIEALENREKIAEQSQEDALNRIEKVNEKEILINNRADSELKARQAFETEKTLVKEKELALIQKKEEMEGLLKALKEREKKVEGLEDKKKAIDEQNQVNKQRECELDEQEQDLIKREVVDTERKAIMDIKEKKIQRKMKQLQLESEI